ncbi:formate dehydrogenase subunit alpha [Methanobrevibacter curvatus]|uniref:Formate dehydrogenase H n=1 Tax=Methanobrevibacter curvatus TaxID=49547 RepID=A0A166A364_9EURY|nr:formate dehydrogenase subunit alpha [Methanobrevibacter curvatus]KZX11502.1 formate dehydrogenase H [Methanobrevibacter curvatus]
MVEMKYVPTICPYCGTGCGLNLVVVDGKVVGVEPWKRHPVNEGKLCPKGTFSHEFFQRDDRLTKPLIRVGAPADYEGTAIVDVPISKIADGSNFREAEWDEALDLIAKKIKTFKPEEVGFLACARSPNENIYITQKFARTVINTHNVDHCARICHGPTVAGLAKTFGSGAMTNDFVSVESADVILIIGSNNMEAHPLFGRRVIRAKKNGAKIIVIDPRYTPTAKLADLYIDFKSGGDVALLNGIMKIIIDEGLQDDEFIENRTKNYQRLKETVSKYDLDTVAKITEADPEKIKKAALMYGQAENSAIVYSLGITEHRHGADNVMANANLAMLTGNIGKVGSGVNPLRGQNNVQGACDMGALPTDYPGYQKVVSEAAQKAVEENWSCTLDSCAPGLTVVEMIHASARGDMKCMYITGEDPVLSDPETNHVIEAMENLDFLVVQDTFMSETARYADVVLPAAGWGEQEGTFTSGERRVQLVRKAVDAPGEAKYDWQIMKEIAERIDPKFADEFTYANAQEIFDEMRKITPQYAGMNRERLERPEALHWPCPTEDHPGQGLMHIDTFAHPDGLGIFEPADYIGPSELPDDDYPLVLTTTRTIFHYHASMTRRCKTLDKELPTGYVEIHPNDAKKLGIANREKVKVRSRRGEIEIPARVTPDIIEGEVNIPMHFFECAANFLTTSKELDPKSKMAELKVCAVTIEKLE